MPELPEVESIKIGLQKHVVNKKITKVFCSDKKLRFNSEIDLNNLKNLEIESVERQARYLVFSLNKNYNLIIHLGMSGKIVFVDAAKTKNYHTQKHDHFICKFEDGSSLIYNDPRRFGFIDLISADKLAQHKMLVKLGVEPLNNDFNAANLKKKLRGKKMNIKTAMMDNKIVVGVGNIYINESLFESAISPLRSASSLTDSEIKKLTLAIKNILKKAIVHGGSSINDYVDANGSSGSFQDTFKVYGKNNKKCLHCNEIITKIVQNGRSTFYCKNCQK